MYLPSSKFAIILINLIQIERHWKQSFSLQLALNCIQYATNLLRVVFHISDHCVWPFLLVNFRCDQRAYYLARQIQEIISI